MEDFKWLFYILLAVVILVLRMWRKAFQPPKPSSQSRPTLPKAYPAPKPPVTSYDEILKEMKASGERAKRTVTPLPGSYSGEAPSVERTDVPAKSLERTEVQAYSLEGPSSLTKKVSKKPSAIEQARQAKPKNMAALPQAVNYGRLLQNPQNMRQAFILSEILNRRIDY